MRLTKAFLFVLLMLGVVSRSFSQETTSEIQGQVKDENGQGLQGATVVAVHQPTGTSYSTTTRKDGYYNLPNLRVGGPYTLTVTFVGFGSEKLDNITLLLGQQFKGNFTLKSQTRQLQEVVVTGSRQGKVFNTGHTGTQEVVNRTQIERLPTINRSLQDFTRLTPQSNGLSFGGQSNQYNNVTVDGANFNNSFGLASTLGGQTNSQPISLDAIEQIQTNISPYDVRQGGFAGAGINSVTRSGTNQIKASVYTYIRTADLQGYNVRTARVPKTPYNYNQRGFTVGGPIVKNKIFFFISAEQERISQPATSFVASDATHQPNQTTISNANADTLNALRQFLVNQFGYDPGAFQGYNYRTQSDKVTAKLDWNINSNNVFTIKYNYLKSFKNQQASNSGSINSSYGRTPGQYAMPFYGSGYTINNNFNIVIAELNTRLGNAASNKLQVGYTALRDFRSSLSNGSFPLVDILDGNNNPYTSFGYEQYTYNNLLNTDVYQLNDIFTLYKGKHEITIGTQNAIRKYQNGFSPSYEGVYRFSSLADFYASVAGVKPALRYDLSYTLTKDGSFPLVGPKETDLGLFAQDKYHVTSNFTVVYGVRFDLPVYQNTFYYNPVVDTLSQFYNNTHLNTGQKPNTNLMVSPRVGFNWDVKGDQTTQVRGGVGLFAGPPPFVWISNQASNSGVAFFGSVSNGQGYIFSPDVNKYRPTSVSSGLGSSYSLNVTDPKFKNPQSLKSNLAVDQKLPNDFVVTLEANYTKNINAVYFENVNLPTTGVVINNGDDHRFRYNSGNAKTSTQIYPIGGTASVSNPNIGNAIYMTNANKGYAYFLTAQIQKNFRNFYANVAYTYTQSKDIMVGGSTASTMWGSKPVTGNPNAPELGYSEGYLPHRVVASAYYRKEYGGHYATSVGAIFEAAPSGTTSYVYNGDLNNDGFFSNDLIYIPRNASEITLEPSATVGGVADPRTPGQIWAQLNNFINQDPYLSKHRGEYAQRNAVLYPWFKRLDLNVTQDFYLSVNKRTNEKLTLRLTADITNVGNLLNSNWGIYRTASVTSPIKFDKMAADGKTPIFSFPYADPANLVPYTNSFKDNISLLSRWQAQFGIRILYN